MSKRILWILTISLSLAMFGLIIVQIKWIRNAVDLKEVQFQQLVNNTLADVSRQIEEYYASSRMNTILQERLSDEIDPGNDVKTGEIEKPVIVFDETENSGVVLKSNIKIEGSDLVEIISDTIIVITHDDTNKVDTIHINQYHDSEYKRKLKESLKEQEILIATIMKKMLLEDVSFEKRVDKQELEKFLTKDFTDRGIDLAYEYSVISKNKNEIYASENFDKNTECYYYRSRLFSNDILDENTYLYLYFPGQRELVRGSLGFLGTSTLLLSILMIILFSLALYVIFKQKKLSDIKNDFVNNMTHELKTPISTISLASQMLNDGSIPDEKKNTRHISNIIQTESKRLGYQVERVLQMAVLDQGHLVLKKSPVSMHEVISTVIQNFILQVENQQGSVEFSDESERSMVNGDRVHLMNVITNLMDNAVKYSKGNPLIAVKLFNSKDSMLKFSIKDSGIGISKENQKKVFERFYRVSTGNVHDVKGFGLGLSYVKLIVEQHGGKIEIASELNRGTKFEITLPLYTEKQN